MDNKQEYYKYPSELHEAALKLLETSKEEADIKKFNSKARYSILRFYTIAPQLPELPPTNEDMMAVFRSIMDWCFKAKEYIKNMPSKMEASVFDRIVELLTELKILPLYDSLYKGEFKGKIQSKAEKDINACNKLISKGKKIQNPENMIKAYIFKKSKCPEDYFLNVAEKVYRTLDKEYAETLEQIQNNIYGIIDRINALESTHTGLLLDQYDILAGMNLQERFKMVGVCYSIDTIVGSWLGRNNIEREPLIESIIQTLKEIKRNGEKENR